jgi:hypothetical protein
LHGVPNPPGLASAGYTGQQRCGEYLDFVKKTGIEVTNQKARATLGIIREVRILIKREDLHVVTHVLEFGIT